MSEISDFINGCHSVLLASSTSNEVGEALFYIENTRELSKNAIETHNIGYCPTNVKVPDSIKFFGKNEWDCSSYINGKIILPIYSEFEDVVALATRYPNTHKDSKWWNLPYPFKKSNYLFLLDKVRKDVFNKNKIYLVEGYFDGILLLKEGLENVCCIMGTKLTTRQVALIARYCNNVCICMDVDANESGQTAQQKLIYILNEFGFCESLSIMEGLPEGEDPDSFVRKNGLDALMALEKQLSSKEISDICQTVRKQNGK